MSAAKFAEISSAIAARIRAGHYGAVLPTTRELAAEFGVARQTITNALRVLVDKGVLTSHRNKLGMRVNPALAGHEVHGLIGIVTPFNNRNHDAGVMYERLSELMEADGCTPVLIGLHRRVVPRIPERLFQADFAGVIVTNSLLTLDMALLLEKRGIPLVSANRLPVYPKLNYVESAGFAALREVMARVTERGYREIALCFVSPLEEYAALIRREWRRIKREYGLPCRHYDDFDIEKKLPPECPRTVDFMAQAVLENLQQTDEPLDVVILWQALGPESLRGFSSGRLRNVLKLQNTLAEDNTSLPGPRVRMRGQDTSILAEPLWAVMRELLLAPHRKPIHKFVDYHLTFMDPIPEYAATGADERFYAASLPNPTTMKTKELDK